MKDFFFSVKFAVICALVNTAFNMYIDGINSFGDVMYHMMVFICLVWFWRCVPYIVSYAFGVIIAIIVILFTAIKAIFSN